MQMAKEAAEAFASNPQGWLLLEGGYGCGKTHLAAAIANPRPVAPRADVEAEQENDAAEFIDHGGS